MKKITFIIASIAMLFSLHAYSQNNYEKEIQDYFKKQEKTEIKIISANVVDSLYFPLRDIEKYWRGLQRRQEYVEGVLNKKASKSVSDRIEELKSAIDSCDACTGDAVLNIAKMIETPSEYYNKNQMRKAIFLKFSFPFSNDEYEEILYFHKDGNSIEASKGRLTNLFYNFSRGSSIMSDYSLEATFEIIDLQKQL